MQKCAVQEVSSRRSAVVARIDSVGGAGEPRAFLLNDDAVRQRRGPPDSRAHGGDPLAITNWLGSVAVSRAAQPSGGECDG